MGLTPGTWLILIATALALGGGRQLVLVVEGVLYRVSTARVAARVMRPRKVLIRTVNIVVCVRHVPDASAPGVPRTTTL